MSRTAIEQGNNNVTTHHDDRILKRRNPHGAGMFELAYPQQAEIWNAYYRNTEYASASLTSSGELSTPYIKGRYPTDQERLAVCEKMLEEGFIMADCRDKRNFIVHGKNFSC